MIGFLRLVGLVVAVALPLGGVFALVWAIVKTKGVETSLGLMVTANAELRSEVADARAALERERRECAAQVAQLRGELDAMVGGVAERLVTAVVRSMQAGEALPPVRTRGSVPAKRAKRT